jgi:hypothetical protein
VPPQKWLLFLLSSSSRFLLIPLDVIDLFSLTHTLLSFVCYFCCFCSLFTLSSVYIHVFVFLALTIFFAENRRLLFLSTCGVRFEFSSFFLHFYFQSCCVLHSFFTHCPRPFFCLFAFCALLFLFPSVCKRSPTVVSTFSTLCSIIIIAHPPRDLNPPTGKS